MTDWLVCIALLFMRRPPKYYRGWPAAAHLSQVFKGSNTTGTFISFTRGQWLVYSLCNDLGAQEIFVLGLRSSQGPSYHLYPASGWEMLLLSSTSSSAFLFAVVGIESGVLPMLGKLYCCASFPTSCLPFKSLHPKAAIPAPRPWQGVTCLSLASAVGNGLVWVSSWSRVHL